MRGHAPYRTVKLTLTQSWYSIASVSRPS